MSSPGGARARPALTDLTNRSRKRGLQSGVEKISGEDVQVSKQMCLGIDNLGVGKKRDDNLVVEKGKYRETGGVGPKAVNLNVFGGTDSGREVILVDDVLLNSCVSVGVIPLGSRSCDGDSRSEEMLQNKTVKAPQCQSSGPEICKTGGQDVDVTSCSLDQCESDETARMVKPCGEKSFELETCTGQKGEGSSNSSSPADLLKTCSCPFCLKAAYIWSDLHYQDIKGQISAVKKSKNEAVSLFQRICLGNDVSGHGQGTSDEPSKLESDLSSQWKSLFLHMKEAFSHESNQLQDQFIALKDLRENCKINLEMIDAKPADHD